MTGLSLGNGSGGSQSTTQSPQSLPNSGLNTAAASKVQPGTATSVLNSNTGISLGNSQLSTIDLNSTSSSTKSQKVSAASIVVPKHHVNTLLLSVCVALFLAAVASFIFVSKIEKNTTNYY